MTRIKLALATVLSLATVLFLVLKTLAAPDYQKGLEAYNVGDYATALKEWRPLAEQGDMVAQKELGNMYRNGQGVPHNNITAARWVRLSAEQGYAEAQKTLARYYEYGSGVPRDYAEALRWYSLAAEQGDVRAQMTVAYMYYNGSDIPQDFTESLRWFSLVAEQGDDADYQAEAMVHVACQHGTGSGVPQDYAEALRWMRLAAEQDDDYLYDIGLRYERGMCLPQDYAEALIWYRLAAEQGHAGAQLNLGAMYGSGQGTARNFIVAHMWSNIAATNATALGLDDDIFGLREDARQNISIYEDRMAQRAISTAQAMARDCMSSGYQNCGY